MTSSDTIFAVASGAARAAICVVRVSGPQTRDIAEALVGRVPTPRRATLVRLRDPATDETLDEALALFFEAAKSELGEDGIEFHLHGSPAVVAAVLEVLGRQTGARAAAPGEFARRAFANGKIDLTQLEALADLIDAETTWQRRQAQRQLSGAMQAVTAPWRAALIAAGAEVETAIDFAEDVSDAASITARLRAHIDPVRAELRAELARPPAAERIRAGVQIVIAGPPNAGKSTLLNALAQREAAIVSAVAGTTRDPIEVHLDLGGCPVTLVDTAGLRESGDAIEQIGVFRAMERAEAADLVLWLSEDGTPPPDFASPVWPIRAKSDLLDADRISPPPCGEGQGWESADAQDRRHLGKASDARGAAGPPPLTPPRKGEGSSAAEVDELAPLALSAKTGTNLDLLIDRLGAFARDLASAGAAAVLTRARHRDAFTAALRALDHAATSDLPIELAAEDLRAARFALDRLIGTVDVEDILGDIFSRFCIGK